MHSLAIESTETREQGGVCKRGLLTCLFPSTVEILCSEENDRQLVELSLVAERNQCYATVCSTPLQSSEETVIMCGAALPVVLATIG